MEILELGSTTIEIKSLEGLNSMFQLEKNELVKQMVADQERLCSPKTGKKSKEKRTKLQKCKTP